MESGKGFGMVHRREHRMELLTALDFGMARLKGLRMPMGTRKLMG